MVSSSRLMSVSPESETPIVLSCSRRWTRSSSALGARSDSRIPTVLSVNVLMRAPLSQRSRLLNADGADFLHVRHPGEALLHAVLLQRAHAILQALRQHLGDAR